MGLNCYKFYKKNSRIMTNRLKSGSSIFFIVFTIFSCQKNLERDLPLPVVLPINGIEVNTVNMNIKLCQWKDDHESSISFTWDDNNWTVKKCSEIFDKYGYKCTFFINPGCYMSNVLIEDYEQTSKKGFEIGNHGLTHTRLDIKGIDDLNNEIIKSKNLLNQKYNSCLSFAYPFHLTSGLADSIIEQTHPFCRNFIKKNSNVMAMANDKDYIYSTRIDSIKKSHSKKTWIIFGGHGIDNNGYNPVPSFEVDSLLKFVSHQNIWVDTFAEVCKYYLAYQSSEISLTPYSITINNKNNYITKLKNFQVKDCIVTINIESVKELDFYGDNIINTSTSTLNNGWFKYLINIDLIKNNKFEYQYKFMKL